MSQFKTFFIVRAKMIGLRKLHEPNHYLLDLISWVLLVQPFGVVDFPLRNRIIFIAVIFDIRRYEQEMVSLAAAARRHGAEIIVFTDQWATPAAKHAKHTFRVQIEAPSAWDSSVVTLFIVEALIEAVQSSTWDETSERMKTLEGLFEQTRLFRKLS